MKEVAIIGAGQSKFGTFVDKGAKELFVEAFEEALSTVDKGIEPREIQEIYIGNLGVCGGQLGNFASMIADSIYRLCRPCGDSGCQT
jgi:acetyl-CoA C-acetyltransferase/acetyl-CoA acyltransferase